MALHHRGVYFYEHAYFISKGTAERDKMTQHPQPSAVKAPGTVTGPQTTGDPEAATAPAFGCQGLEGLKPEWRSHL